jgi:hypothetical protein
LLVDTRVDIFKQCTFCQARSEVCKMHNHDIIIFSIACTK